MPYELPQRQFGLWKQSSLDPDIIEDRKITLANFLQDLLNDSFDTKWKNSPNVCKFLKLPTNWNSYEPKNSDLPSSQGNMNDPTQWLTTFRDSKHLLESCKRGMGSSMTRDLMQLRLVLHDLENTLKHSSEKLGQTEYARRYSLLQTLKKDMNEFALQSSSRTQDGSSSDNNNNNNTYNSNNDDGHSDLKMALFEGPIKPRAPKKPALGRRRFGETEETAPLNNQQLLQLHKDSMSKQDLEMEQMHKIVQRQKDLSLAMNQELLQDNELLDSLNDGVDSTASKLRTANRRAKQFNNE